MRFRTLLTLAAVGLALLTAVPAGAGAADTHAPRGARLDWLPTDEWVMSGWLPFDEARLDAVVGTDHDELARWLDDHRTLAQLARRHGVDRSVTALAHTL